MSTCWLIGGCSAHALHRRHPHSLVGSALGLRPDLALVERHLPYTGLSKAWRSTRGVWLVAAVVVYVGAFLCFLPTELDVSPALRAADSPPLDRGAEVGYIAVAQEEAGQADKDPVNADLLTMLLLGVASLFGSSFGWVLTDSQRQGTLCSSLGVVGEPSASACEDPGVLRL
jgi:hypothetical protein